MLPVRFVRAVIDPGALFEAPAAARSWIDLLLVAAILAGAANYLFWRSEAGLRLQALRKQATIDRMRGRVPDTQLAQYERAAPAFETSARAAAVAKAIGLVTATLLWAVAAHLLLSVLLLRTDVGFGSVAAVFAQGAVVWLVAELFIILVMIVTGDARTATSPMQLFPQVAWPAQSTFAGSFIARLDLFDAWWIPVVCVGLSRLYGIAPWPLVVAVVSLKLALAALLAFAFQPPDPGAGTPLFRHSF